MKKLMFPLIGLLLLLIACTPSAKPIEYGSDKCDFCRMTIVDQQHAAEAVTTKGRIYKFDAIECMVQFQQQEETMEFAMLLVNDYLDSGVLLEAQRCRFLISQNVPSPMGANLSAFINEGDALEFQRKKGGELYTWPTLLEHLNE